MAEVIVGFVSAGVGITAFALQISSSIDALRQMRSKPGEAHKDLTTLLDRLAILHQVVSTLKAWEGYQLVDIIIQHVQERYDEIEPTLRGLLEKYQEQGEGPRHHWKRAQLMVSRQPKQQIKDVGEKINEIVSILHLAFMAAQCQPPSSQKPLQTVKEDPDPSAAQEGDPNCGKLEGVVDEAEACFSAAIQSSRVPQQEHRILLSAVKTTSHARGTRRYNCSCHLASTSGRFWFLQYTPLSSFIRKPKECASGCSCISLRLRLALSMYGIPIAIVAGIGLMVDETSFDLRPALRAERIVNYTSPGFEAIWRLEKGLISLPEAREKFIELYRSDSSLRYHKDPAGKGYIQTLLQYPWLIDEDQFGLLHVLATDCQMTLEDEPQSFLVQCAQWIGEGDHLGLLEAVLAYGFDATAIHAPSFEKWPVSCSPDWYGAGRTPDPFFIRYIGMILTYSPNYSGSTYLHNVLLNGSLDSATHWLHRSQPLEDNVNFLGQTPLHIVAANLELCRLVLDAGHDINATDNLGVTPLMYAAAMGQTGVAKLLISRGANPGLMDSKMKWMFLDYAFFCGHWDLALDALMVIQSLVDSKTFQLFVQYTIRSALIHRINSTERMEFLPRFIRLCDDINFRFTDHGIKDNNLMHYACNIEMASTLVQCGFQSFNQRNSEGKLAINSLFKCPDARVIKLCLEKGTDVANVGQDGRTLLFDLLPGLAVSSGWLTWDVVDAIRLCLRAGADPFATDDCICPCSPEGCHISSIFRLQFSSCYFFDPMPSSVWAFEFVSLLEEYCGIQAAEKLLLSLLRRIKCDQAQISIAHVCCHRGQGIGKTFSKFGHLEGEDIKEILDEESEFIDVLDTEMERLTSFTFPMLRAEFMAILREEYNDHIQSMKAERKICTANSKPSGCRVDYQGDEFIEEMCVPFPESSAHSISRSLAQYAFWLQHERYRSNSSFLPNFHPTGWFERRIFWFIEFINMMEVTDEMLEKAMGSIYVEETRTEKVDPGGTVKSFLETLRKTRMEGGE
ncbi:hypothetical protein FSARC_651 [Fusarium sarcochroum]|uniref:Ankyrin n=1 Tax=Fusarium sarcochroum TaxID=1208366 RepID=A0A8H4UB10_9HYPO|nr:hypothetical protein FSARC_651 [Fusarium sarcochroum]